jgi:hypothetical protein
LIFNEEPLGSLRWESKIKCEPFRQAGRPESKKQFMIGIHGEKSFKGGSEKSERFVCENCGGKHTTELTCYHNYYHVFFIPVFPNGRNFVLQCSACGHIQNLQPKENQEFRYLLKKYPNPVWMWVGTPIYTAFLAWAFYTEFFKK